MRRVACSYPMYTSPADQESRTRATMPAGRAVSELANKLVANRHSLPLYNSVLLVLDSPLSVSRSGLCGD